VVWGQSVVNAEELNIRSGPGVKYDVIGTFKKGQEVNVLETISGWAKVSYGDKTAWVYDEYLTDTPVVRAPVNNISNVSTEGILIFCVCIGFVILCILGVKRRAERQEKYNLLREKAEDTSLDSETRRLAMQDMNNMEADARAERIMAAQRASEQRASTMSSGPSVILTPGNTIIKHKMGGTEFVHDSHGNSATIHHVGDTTFINHN
jgi:uncharacterized protein YgiM (DUF1202 family)